LFIFFTALLSGNNLRVSPYNTTGIPMGILDELIILVKEAMDEANGRPGGGQPRPETTSQHRSGEELENMRRTLARRALAQREAAQREQNEQHQSAHDEANAAQLRQAHEKARRQALLAQPANAQPTAHSTDLSAPLSAHNLRQLVQQPQAMRQLFVMKEILDKPLALRRAQR
jgi:hypothetical protein